MKKDPSNLISIKEAATLLGVHKITLRRWEKKGSIKVFRIGPRRDRRYDKGELLKLLETN